MNDTPFFKNSVFWRRLILIGLFILYLALFWEDLGPGLRGYRDLLLILFRIMPAGMDTTLLPSMLRLGINAVIYMGVWLISIFVTAQFVLPVKGWKERWQAFWRLLSYWSKIFRGPAVLVHNGQLVSRAGEEENTNPGVVVVDLRSAVVLEQEYPYLGDANDLQEQPALEKEPDSQRFTGLLRTLRLFRPDEKEYPTAYARGPGIHFTGFGEKIRTTVDLRRQVRMIFGEPIITSNGKKNPQPGVKAFTRDGIEIGANCYVVFSLSDPPDVIPVAYWGGNGPEHLHELDISKEGESIVSIKAVHRLDASDAEEIHESVLSARIASSAFAPAEPPVQTPSRYPFDENRVFAAAYGQAYRASPNEKAQWHQLPLIIAADIFRNLLEKYNFDYLYSADNPSSLPWMDDFKPEFSRHVRYQGILSYQLVRSAGLSGREAIYWNIPLNGKPLEIKLNTRVNSDALEFSTPYPLVGPKSLRDRGIKVVVAGFSELKIPLEIREKMVERWKARWEREIQIVLARQDREVMQIISSARNRAQRDNAYFLSNLFNEEKYSTEALALLIFQSLELASTDLKNQKDLPPKEVLAMLQNLHKWLLRERQEMVDRKNHRNGKHPPDD